MPTLRFSRRRAATGDFPEMTLGDVLFRLAVLSRKDLMAVDTIARAALKRVWPPEGDQLLDEDEAG